MNTKIKAEISSKIPHRRSQPKVLHGRMKHPNMCCWYFVTKIVLTYCEKNCSSDREKLLKFEAEGREFAKFLRSLEQFI